MGQSPSKRVNQTLLTSPEFNSSCNSIYTESTHQTNQPKILPYQLHSAISSLHHSLSSTCPLIIKYSPAPPSRLAVDSAFRRFNNHRGGDSLDCGEFRVFAAEVFTSVVVMNAGKAVLSRVPVGVMGIVGVGVVGKVRGGLVGTAIGAYALGVATSVYLSLA